MATMKSLQIGLTYLDDDYGNVEPFRMVINGNGHVYTNGNNIFSGGAGWASQGDYFRIRHYASDNTIRFQKRQIVYNQLSDVELEVDQIAQILTTHTRGGVTFNENEIVTIFEVMDEGNPRFIKADGQTKYGLSSARGTEWQVVENLGTDYVTFHTHSELSNGNNLYVDTSLFHVGSRLNDVLLAK